MINMMNLFLLFLAISVPIMESARILAVMPTLSKSHYASSKNILLALAERHDVVVISPFEEKNPPKGWSWIPIILKSLEEAMPTIKKMTAPGRSFFQSQKEVWEGLNDYAAYISNLTEVNNFIRNDKSHFDLVIAEEFFQQTFYAFSDKYKAPLVLLSSFGSAHYINEYMGNALELTSVPHEFSNMYSVNSISDRAWNVILVVYDLIGRKQMNVENQNEISKAVFGLPNSRHVGDIERDAALILMNSHFSVNVIQPFLPNMIEIAGAHIVEPKPLEKELRSILDNAKHGVILFSYGSLLEVAKLPTPAVLPILKALGKLKQDVIIKWNSDEAPPVTFKNVHTVRWVPQNDLLAHPNTIAFVTHGGLLSSQEAIYHGVPIVCVPFFGDQPLNCQRAVKLGFGVKISPKDVTEETLFDSLHKITTDASYRETAKELSRRFKDRPLQPVDNAVFWIEYVIRHKGADFIKGPKRNLYWYQILYLDIISLFLVAFLFVRKVVTTVYGVVFKKSIKVKTN